MRLAALAQLQLTRTARQERTHWLRTLYLSILATAIILSWYAEVASEPLWSDQEAVGSRLFQTFTLCQYALILLITPLTLCGAFQEERRRGTLPILLSTQLRPIEVLAAKFLAGVLPLALLILSGIPVTALLMVFGGISLWMVASVYIKLLAAMTVCGATALWASIRTKTMIGSLFLTAGVCAFPFGALFTIEAASNAESIGVMIDSVLVIALAIFFIAMLTACIVKRHRSLSICIMACAAAAFLSPAYAYPLFAGHPLVLPLEFLPLLEKPFAASPAFFVIFHIIGLLFFDGTRVLYQTAGDAPDSGKSLWQTVRALLVRPLLISTSTRYDTCRNPVLQRESGGLRAVARRVVRTLIWGGVVVGGLTVILVNMGDGGQTPIALMLAIPVLTIPCILLPLATGVVAFAAERDRQTLKLLLSCPLHTHDLLLGKALGVLARCGSLVLFLVAVPFAWSALGWISFSTATLTAKLLLSYSVFFGTVGLLAGLLSRSVASGLLLAVELLLASELLMIPLWLCLQHASVTTELPHAFLSYWLLPGWPKLLEPSLMGAHGLGDLHAHLLLHWGVTALLWAVMAGRFARLAHRGT